MTGENSQQETTDPMPTPQEVPKWEIPESVLDKSAGGPATPGDDPGLSLENLSDAQVDAIQKRIEERQANRPESLAKQLEDLRNEISGASQSKHEASERRKQSRDEADTLDATIAKLQTQIRRTELKEAVDAAGFAKPGPIVDLLVDKPGDVAELVAAAAASGAYVMKKPAPSAPVGGLNGGAAQMDPGRAALMKEIAEAQQRGV